ncbi:PGPEP1 [Bugula neritina]|uniref:PGPEP1 n=1 Tax=Bugula neritina TaxID=10212 RepID=A0A7J7KNJ3_BUGNE|nr:PGPEP1 [Bugula neritina]
MEVPVTYDAVQIIVPRLWEEYKPQLVVHVGVSHLAEELTIEKLAHNCGYKSLDVNGKTAPSQCYSKTGAECLHTTLDVDKLCKDINDSSCLAMALPSTDAGRYLCEYIYYASLSHSTSSVMFIHVPKLNKPYTVAELADALRCAVLAALKQLNLLHSLPLPGKHVLEEIQRQNNQITKTRELL